MITDYKDYDALATGPECPHCGIHITLWLYLDINPAPSAEHTIVCTACFQQFSFYLSVDRKFICYL